MGFTRGWRSYLKHPGIQTDHSLACQRQRQFISYRTIIRFINRGQGTMALLDRSRAPMKKFLRKVGLFHPVRDLTPPSRPRCASIIRNSSSSTGR